MSDFEQMVSVSLAAATGNFRVLSTGEQLAAALVLNRADWLAEIGYTIPEAIDRIGNDWVHQLRKVERAVLDELASRKQSQYVANKGLAAAAFASEMEDQSNGDRDGTLFNATYVTYSNAPGYRDITVVLDLHPLSTDRHHRVSVRLSPDDSQSIALTIRDIHACAWHRGSPIDVKDGEQKPGWLNESKD